MKIAPGLTLGVALRAMSWLTIGVWACALSAATCTAVVLVFLFENRRAHAAAMSAIEGLGETHMAGFAALTSDLDRLKTRVAELERRL